MKTVFHPANLRGNTQSEWLNANFSFSFGPYYNPERIRFGALRVLNDDFIGAGKGFGAHPHDNMEIITVVLKGALEHKDNVGGDGIIKAGEVQIITAGTGVSHSEFNPSATEETNSLQIWVYPKVLNVSPNYQQKSFTDAYNINQLTALLTPDGSSGTLKINQDAVFSIGKFEQGQQINYPIQFTGNGAYVFLLEGEAEIDNQVLNKRDALGVYDTSSFTIITKAQSRVLIIEVPML
ncbi:pirin family protein [Mucilaginibacter lacusdianchii]|uniref:pirin family protein n=1 Tax=Mucilaginibacter lacusdianchii TaxID=2684211 RepID=UPI00131AE228|nr:pirin family protein [Mucilaginibacter sp. JXJ CY 39]